MLLPVQADRRREAHRQRITIARARKSHRMKTLGFWAFGGALSGEPRQRVWQDSEDTAIVSCTLKRSIRRNLIHNIYELYVEKYACFLDTCRVSSPIALSSHLSPCRNPSPSAGRKGSIPDTASRDTRSV